MGFTESLVRIIFRGRVRMMERIGEAARLIGEGRAEETLEILGSMERRIPPYVGYLFFLTRGCALDALRRYEEAEVAFTAAVFAKQGATEAHLHLAVLAGKTGRLDEARAWIGRLREDGEAPEALLERAAEVEALLAEVEDGTRLASMRARARAFGERRGLGALAPREALGEADRWVEAEPEEARVESDDLACWLGELAAAELGGAWRVSLSLEESVVEAQDREIRPFDLVAARLQGGASLLQLLETK